MIKSNTTIKPTTGKIASEYLWSRIVNAVNNVSEFEAKLLLGLSVVSYIHFVKGNLAEHLLWRIVVAYVGANHFVYGLHNLLGRSAQISKGNQDILIKLAGVGGMLKSKRAATWVWGFDEHRVSDVCMHLGMALSCPWRIDHWMELMSHMGKYAGIHVELIHHHHEDSGLSLCDMVDVTAHCVSALSVLGFSYFLFAIILAEAFRLVIHASTVNQEAS